MGVLGLTGCEALAASGVPALTGWPAGPPVSPPPAFATRLSTLTARIASASEALGRRVELDWGSVLCGRAALLGFERGGDVSANRSCRLLRCADGWVALNLSRPDDRAALGALLAPATDVPVDPLDPWPAIRVALAGMTTTVLEAQGRLLGVPVGVLRRAAGGPPQRSYRRGEATGTPATGPARGGTARRRRPLVADLSSMWAGPLATRILAAAGAEVVKVELDGRSDGAAATPDFYRWLHPDDQHVVAIDTATETGRTGLRALLRDADVVVESSRPRALAQIASGAADLPARPGQVWLSITAHGREGVAGERVGFGDDAAVAGGLVGWDGEGRPVFVADAVADPVTGLVAAEAVLTALRAGGGVLIDAAMARSAGWLAGGAPWGRPPPDAQVVASGHGWAVGAGAPVLAPVAAPPVPEARRAPAVAPATESRAW